jgi:hypothetical protein
VTAPKDRYSESVKVFKVEDITTKRQHIMVEYQENVPETLADIARTMREGRATGEVHVHFNQGGCRGIITEQVIKAASK